MLILELYVGYGDYVMFKSNLGTFFIFKTYK